MLKKATKEQAKLRLSVYGLSGGGKTYSSLAIAKGLCDAFGGKIAVLDTEYKTASKYANLFAFETDEFGEPSIANYLKFIDMVKEDPDVTVLIIDSLTHAWHSCLERVDKLKETTCKGDGRKAWGIVTPEYKRLVNAIIQAPFHVIGTMRAKTEWSSSNENGTKSVRRDTLAPEQREGFEYEFDMVIEMNASHYGTVIKDRTGKFQDEIIHKPGVEFGKKLADWLRDGAIPMDQQIQSVLTEIGNIINSVNEMKIKYFTEAEYNAVKKDCIDSKSKSQAERLEYLNGILNEQKNILIERISAEGSEIPQDQHEEQVAEEVKAEVAGTETTETKAETQEHVAAETAGATAKAAPEKTPPKKTEKKEEKSLSKELEKIAQGNDAAKTQTETTSTAAPPADDGFVDDIPGEETTETAEQELDIF